MNDDQKAKFLSNRICRVIDGHSPAVAAEALMSAFGGVTTCSDMKTVVQSAEILEKYAANLRALAQSRVKPVASSLRDAQV